MKIFDHIINYIINNSRLKYIESVRFENIYTERRRKRILRDLTRGMLTGFLSLYRKTSFNSDIFQLIGDFLDI